MEYKNNELVGATPHQFEHSSNTQPCRAASLACVGALWQAITMRIVERYIREDAPEQVKRGDFLLCVNSSHHHHHPARPV